MIYPIRLYGDPVLRKISAPISQKFPNIKQLIDDMFETMHKAKGIGLSAVQIGLPIRVFVIEAHLEEPKFNFKGSFINPIIEKQWGNVVNHPEGCLSIPGLTALVERPENILMTYYTPEWEKRTEEYSGWEARIIQHEYDHLEGVLYPDLLTGMWKKLLDIPLESIEKRRIEAEYLTK